MLKHFLTVKKIFVNLFIFLFQLNLSVQAQDIKKIIDQYQCPDYKIKKWDINYSGNSNFYTNKVDTFANSDHLSISADLNSFFSLNFFTRKYVGVHYLNSGFFSGLDNQNSKTTNTVNNKYNSLNIPITMYSDNIFYLKNNLFTNVHIYNNINMSNSNRAVSINNVDEKYKNKKIEGNFETKIGLGKGRIESVTSLAQTLFLINDLKQKNLLNKEITEEQIVNTAKFIDKLKTIRFFDIRIMTIYELKQLDSALNANNIVNNSSIDFFAVLNDNWNMINVYNRFNGYKYSFGFKNIIKLTNENNKYTNFSNNLLNTSFDSKYTVMEYIAYINFEKQKTFNLNWSTSFYTEFSCGKVKKKNIAEYNNDIISADLGYGLEYYPNTRTFFRLNIGGNYMYSLNSNTPDYLTKKDYYLVKTYFGVLFNYYISERFRLIISNDLTYYRNNLFTHLDKTFDANSLNNSFEVKLNYSIF